MTNRHFTGSRKTFPKLTMAAEGRDVLNKAARMIYGDGVQPTLLALELFEASLAGASAVDDPEQRQALLHVIHAKAHDAAHNSSAH